MRKRREPTIETLAAGRLPLRPAAFAVLSALARGPRAGFEILEFVNATHPGSGLLGPGTLYRVLRELRQEGLIERTPAPADEASQDERRTYSVLTRVGRATVLAEAARLRRTLTASGLLEEGAAE
jgi:PadR family transcriptional regulator, regulatory protein PadR